MKKLVAASVAFLMITACTDQYGNGPGTKQTVGTLLGAAGGAALGSNIGKGKGQIVGIAAGTLLGAAVGSGIGASLDRADKMYYNQTYTRTLETVPSGQTVAWQNPDSGNSGSFTPTRTYQNNGQYCREFTQTIRVGGQQQQGYGVACRQPDGTWQIVQQ